MYILTSTLPFNCHLIYFRFTMDSDTSSSHVVNCLSHFHSHQIVHSYWWTAVRSFRMPCCLSPVFSPFPWATPHIIQVPKPLADFTVVMSLHKVLSFPVTLIVTYQLAFSTSSMLCLDLSASFFTWVQWLPAVLHWHRL